MIHCSQLSCDNHGNIDASHGNNNGNAANAGNSDNVDDNNGDGGCDYDECVGMIAMDVAMALVVTASASAVAKISTTVIIDHREGLKRKDSLLCFF